MCAVHDGSLISPFTPDLERRQQELDRLEAAKRERMARRDEPGLGGPMSGGGGLMMRSGLGGPGGGQPFGGRPADGFYGGGE